MSEFEGELLIRLGKALEELRAKQGQLSSLERGREADKSERLLFSAMLADISEVIFGKQAQGAPKFLSNVHGGWVCGPGGLKPNECYVEAFYRLRKQINITTEWIAEWKAFLSALNTTPEIEEKKEV